MQSCAILLHDHTGHYILVRFLKLRQDLQTCLYHRSGPVVDLVVLIGISTDGVLYGLLDDLADIVHDK